MDNVLILLKDVQKDDDHLIRGSGINVGKR